MRMAFICSSLEPGRDGVGDYCRRLGSEMERLGHDIFLISLNDRWQKGQSSAVNKHLSVLRCGLSTSLARRAEMAREALRRFCPDWVSLQYVCFGYHPRGLAWRWNPVFAELGNMGSHRHLMLHELWIGPPPLHRWLIGWGQRQVIRDLQRRFRPDIVNTSMNSYQHRLSRIGITARVLPLFGNIPIAHRKDDRITGLLKAAGSRMVQRPRAAFLNGVFFGTIHPDFDTAPLIRWLGELRTKAEKPILLTMIGRAGKSLECLAKQLNSSVPDAIEVVSLGEQPEEIISQALQFADFGINTGSPEMLGKSGTFAAMQEHGLPVVLADGEVDVANLKNGLPPVLQFTTGDSVTTLMNYTSLPNVEAGATQSAVDLVRLFERAAVENRPATDVNLV
jgi:hypothetical protein